MTIQTIHRQALKQKQNWKNARFFYRNIESNLSQVDIYSEIILVLNIDIMLSTQSVDKPVAYLGEITRSGYLPAFRQND